ncbi:MAG: TetR/AcrR family transcriptional regulator, partial [Clostridia bacterium]|nr:TetR/AcrR family transcriptional regulator [Clostridia bacterium]
MKYSASNQITKNALLQSFTGLLTKKPLDEITIGEITDNIGLSRKTFYYHFSDINDLVLWTFNKQIKSALETSDIEQNKQVGLKMFLQELEKRR